jgi:hypothetical protein
MPQSESSPSSEPATPRGGTPPVWPDVSKTSRGFRAPVGVGVAVVAFLAGLTGLDALRGPANNGSVALPPTIAEPRLGATGDPTATRRATAPQPGDLLPNPPGPAAGPMEHDCVSIAGPSSDPVVKIVRCGPGTYQVIKRFDGTADPQRCKDVPNVTFRYRWDDPTDGAHDFVLCLRN